MTDLAPNHHHDHPGFSGVGGLVAALTFSVGRTDAARLAARLVALGSTDTLIDIGCGPGVAARHAASLGATVTGVDPADVMLRTARVLGSGRSTRSVRYLHGTAEALPIDDAGATVVWSLSTVHHWTDVDAGLREVRRVLRPDGRFLALEKVTRPGSHGHASHGWTPAQADAFAACCLAHGFGSAEVQQHAGGRRPLVSVLAGPG